MISRFNNTAGHTSNRPHSMQLHWDSCVQIGRKLSEKGSLHNLVLSPSHRPVFDWKPSKFGWREGLGTRLFMFHAWCSRVFMLKLMQPKTWRHYISHNFGWRLSKLVSWQVKVRRPYYNGKFLWSQVQRVIVSLSIIECSFVFKFKPTKLASICVPIVTV